MKRLLLFGSIFGFGLLVLVLVLGPGRLVRESGEQEIGDSNLADVRTAVSLKESGQGGATIGVAMEGAGRIPIWKERVLPDGSVQRVKAALLAYRGIEPFAGGFHFDQPHLEFFPGVAVDERATAVIDAEGCDLALHGEQSGAAQFAQGFKPADVKAFTFSPKVVVQKLDPTSGATTLRFETERLEAPELPLTGEVEPLFLERLIAPGPLRLQQGDGFDLRAGGLELDRRSGRLTLQPPLALTATEFDLPGLTADAPADAPTDAPADAPAAPPAKRARTAAPRPPLFLTSDGPATYLRADPTADAPASGAASPATEPPRTASPADAFDLDQALGPGEIVFTNNVLLKQEERWLRTERLALTLARNALGELVATHVDAGRVTTPLAFGLLGGEGDATQLEWSEREQALVLQGPVALRNLVLGEGAAARKFELAARERLRVRNLPADATLPERIELTLEQGAHVAIAGELVADGDRIVALLLPPTKETAAAPGAEARPAEPLRLLAVELTGAPATATMSGRGDARARLLRLTESADGTRTIHLDGDARAEFERGFVEGPTLDLTLPLDPKAPTTVLVPRLLAAELELPAGAAPFEPRFAATSGATAPPPDAPVPPRRLKIEPLGPCSLTQIGEQVDLVGRAIYRVRAVAADSTDAADSADSAVAAAAAAAADAAPDLQTLHADELHLQPDGAGAYRARALGDIVLLDPSRGLVVRGALARTETATRAGREVPLLRLEGKPAHVELTPPQSTAGVLLLDAPDIELDLERGSLLAVDPAGAVRLHVPEVLLADLFPSLALPDTLAAALPAAPAAATPPAADGPAPLQLSAERIEFTPGEGADPFQSGALHLARRVVVIRPADGSVARCDTLDFDLAAGTAALDGRPDAPVVLQRPKPYATERIDALTTAWIRIDRRRQRITAAPSTLLVLHPEEAPTPERPVPPLVRIELRTSDSPELQGRRVALGGGVEMDLTFGDRLAHARAERAELLLSNGLEEGPFEPLRLNLSQRVRLDYGDYHATGDLLSYRIRGTADDTPAPGWIELKEGVEPGALLGQDEAGRWLVTARFKRMRVHPPSTDDPREMIEFDGLSLVVEAAHGE